MHISQLPTDLLCHIIESLGEVSCESLANIALVSHQLQVAVSSSQTWCIEVDEWSDERRTSFLQWLDKQPPHTIREMGVKIANERDWGWIAEVFQRPAVRPNLQIEVATQPEGLLGPLLLVLTSDLPMPVWITRVTHLVLEGEEHDMRYILSNLFHFERLEEFIVQFRSIDLSVDLDPQLEPFPIRGPLPSTLRVLLAEDAVGRVSRSLAKALPPSLEELSLFLAADVVDSLPDLPNLHTLVAGGSIQGNVLTDLMEKCPNLQHFYMPVHVFGCDISNLHLFRPPAGLVTFAAWVMDGAELSNAEGMLPLWDSKITDLTLRIEDTDITDVPDDIVRMPLERLQLETPGTIFLPDLRKLDKLELLMIRASTATIEMPPPCQVFLETFDVASDSFLEDVDEDDEMEDEAEGSQGGAGDGEGNNL